MDKIKKTNMNIKKITIAMLITLISIGNINAQEMKTEIPKISEFPTGNENTGFEQYFSGKSWLAPLTSNKDLNVPMFNVTFEPNCRNNWHTHTGGHRTKRRALARRLTGQLVFAYRRRMQSPNQQKYLA